jgi:hypothetical protein
MQQCRDKVGHAVRDASKNSDGKKKKPSHATAAQSPTNQTIRRIHGRRQGFELRDYQAREHPTLSNEVQELIPGLHNIRNDTMSLLAQQRLREGNQLMRDIQLRDEHLMAQQQHFFMTQQLRPQQQLQLQLSQQQGSQGLSVARMPWQNPQAGAHFVGRNTSLPLSRNYDALGFNEMSRVGRASSLGHIQNRPNAEQFRRISTTGVRPSSALLMEGADNSVPHDQLIASIGSTFGGAFGRRRATNQLSQEEQFNPLLYPDPLSNPDGAFVNNRMNFLGIEEDEEGDPLIQAIDSALGPLSSDDSPEGQQQRLEEQLLANAQYHNHAGLSRMFPPNQQR